MKLFKSIKWRLQLWYGLILVLVLAGFGFTAYQLEWGRQMRRIDDELHRRVGILANALRRPPPPRPDIGEQFLSRPPGGQLPGDRPPVSPVFQKNRSLPEFRLRPEDAHFFDASDPHKYNFIITLVSVYGDKVIARSTNQPARPVPMPTTVLQAGMRAVNSIPLLEIPLPGAKPPKEAMFMFGEDRVVMDFLPSGESIEVGCSVSPELRELHRTALNLMAVGGLILFIGLTGGWWFVSRALRPVENISSTAVKISAGDLSQRINIAETESELGLLAAVLNSTFARLDAAFAQQKQFASDAAHELRTPVTVILTQTQTALGREREAASYKETIEACQRAAQRMRRLIGALLELARLDAGQEQMKRLRFDLAKTIADSIELTRPLADEHGIKLLSELPPLEINGDPERLSRVITNLLTNAIQYNKPGGEVRLQLKPEGGLAVLTVADTGQGIATEDLPRVFERFHRGDKSRIGENAGLGLAIAKAIVESHGGTIEVASREDAGTTFTVRLPAGRAGPD
jgi:two-component system, OmpR family, sensor kinase